MISFCLVVIQAGTIPFLLQGCSWRAGRLPCISAKNLEWQKRLFLVRGCCRRAGWSPLFTTKILEERTRSDSFCILDEEMKNTSQQRKYDEFWQVQTGIDKQFWRLHWGTPLQEVFVFYREWSDGFKKLFWGLLRLPLLTIQSTKEANGIPDLGSFRGLRRQIMCLPPSGSAIFLEFGALVAEIEFTYNRERKTTSFKGDNDNWQVSILLPSNSWCLLGFIHWCN